DGWNVGRGGELTLWGGGAGSDDGETGRGKRPATWNTAVIAQPESRVSRSARASVRLRWRAEPGSSSAATRRAPCRTVEWSRRNSRAIWARGRPLSSRVRYIARWRARVTFGEREGESSTSREIPSTAQTASWIAGTVG